MGKVLISMPDELIAKIDKEASGRGVTRSAFLRDAAQRELGWPDQAEFDAAVQRGRDALAGLGSFESAEAIRKGRDDRDARDRRR